MQVQVNTGHNIEGREAFIVLVTSMVESALDRFSGRITRVEVYLTDENSDKKGGVDTRCVMEARLEGRPPVAVTDQAASAEQAVEGAAGKLVRLIDSTLGRLA